MGIAIAIVAGLGAAVLVFRRSPAWRWTQLFHSARKAIEHQLYPQAEQLLRHATAATQNAPRLAATRVALGEVLHRLGRLPEADRHLRESIPALEACFPAGHFEIGRAYALRGELELDRGDYAEAQRCFQHALAEDERTGNQARRLFTLQRLSEALLRQGNQPRALDIVEQCMSLEREFMNRVNDGRQYILMSLPDLRFCQGEWEDARRLYQEKVEYFERLTAPGIDVGHYQWRLAASLEHAGDHAGAAAFYRRSAETYRRSFCEDHPRVGVSLARLAVALDRAGEDDKARATRQEARDLLDRHGLAEHPELASMGAAETRR
jgi:tetratricopeptide (TPR) repeat protein